MAGGNSRIRRIAPDGRSSVFAGITGIFDDTGDGLPATQATFNAPWGVTVDAEGGVFVVDAQNSERVRRISPNNIVSAVVSQRGITTEPAGDRGPATAANLKEPVRTAVAPDGSLYVTDPGDVRVRKVISPLPGFASVTDILIPSRDGRELYVFNSRGRHKRTVSTLLRDNQPQPQPVILYDFGYDDDGRLTRVTDRNGNISEITRNPSQVTITGPYNQVTTLALNGNGYAQSLTNPNNETTLFVYSPEGRLNSVTDPKNETATFSYDSNGRLTDALYPQEEPLPNVGDTLVRSAVPVNDGTGYQVLHTTAEGVQTTYKVEFRPDGNQVRTTDFADGRVQIHELKIDGSEVITQPTDVVETVLESPDPRFGMQAPVTQTTVRVPLSDPPASYLTASVSQGRTVSLSNPVDPFSVTTHTETVTVNTRSVTRQYTAATRTYADTSPEDRVTTTVLDERDRPIQQQVGNLTASAFSYDPDTQQLSGVVQGARSTSITYHPDGTVESVTDAAGRTVSFTYDDAGRVKTQTLPDTRVIELDYDAKGNVIGITTPSLRLHEFAYSPTDQPRFYMPPDVPSAVPPLTNPDTEYRYNLSGQLTHIIRPDGQTIFLDYDLETGDLITQVLPAGQGQRNFTYDVETGNLELLAFPNGSLTYAYDGNLLKQEAWGGTVAGTVNRTYDSSFRVKQVTINDANPIEFTYDDDDLLESIDNDPSTGPEDMTLIRDPSIGFGAGLLTGTTLGVVTDSYGYNAFGEATSYTARVSGTPVFDVTDTRDHLGRITSKTETIDGSPPDTYVYGYDPAGRLTDVTKNTFPHAHYEYDANSNRIPDANNDGIKTSYRGVTLDAASYDEQDRLVSTTEGPQLTSYTYSENGELESKTQGTDTTSYSYDVLGNLKHVELPNGDDLEYLVDGRDRRIGRTLTGAPAQRLLFDGQLTPVAELNGSNVVIGRFVYASKTNVPDYLIRGATIYRIISDHLGSPRLVIDASTTGLSIAQRIVQRTDYDEFGNIVFEDIDPSFQRLPFGFAGGLYDPTTGLTRFGARDYDPRTGRWTAKDPIGFRGRNANLYGYVAAEPVNRTDPQGKFVSVVETSGSFALNAIVATFKTLVTACITNVVSTSLGFGSFFDLPLLNTACSVRSSDPDCTRATPFHLDKARIFRGQEEAFKAEYVGKYNAGLYDICACRDGSIRLARVGQCGGSGPKITTSATW